MSNLLKLILVIVIICNVACNDDPLVCDGVVGLEQSATFNGDQILLTRVDVNQDVAVDLDTYEFLIEAVGPDCSTTHKFRFYLSHLCGQDLDGDYPVLESIVFTDGRLTSGSYGFDDASTPSFDFAYAIDGSATITSLTSGGYELDLYYVFEEWSEVRLTAEW